MNLLVLVQADQQQTGRLLKAVMVDRKLRKRDFPVWHCTSAVSLISVNDTYICSSICAAMFHICSRFTSYLSLYDS